jgi:hypothetical protein
VQLEAAQRQPQARPHTAEAGLDEARRHAAAANLLEKAAE